jgi:lysophospholipase L1-like esterase
MVFAALCLMACASVSEPGITDDIVLPVPQLDQVRIDGDPGDWQMATPPVRIFSDIEGKLPDPGDFKAEFRLGWDSGGLLFQVQVVDDVIYENHQRHWKGDGMEIFISPAKGSPDIVQISLRPSLDALDSIAALRFFDYRVTDSLLTRSPQAKFYSVKTPSGYFLEGRIPLDMLGIVKPAQGRELALQFYSNDADRPGDTSNYSLPWYPVRDAYRNPYAFHRIRLAESGFPGLPMEVRSFVMNEQKLFVKLHSAEPADGRKLMFRSGEFHRRFSLHQEQTGIYSKTLEFPAGRILQNQDQLQFLYLDRVFFSMESILLPRKYEAGAEPHRFEPEIRIFEILDHFNPPSPGGILITGSSTIRKWQHLEEDLPGLHWINRGFGGSTMEELIHFSERIVFPYHPSLVIVYEGDNDLASGISPDRFIESCRMFVENCRDKIPDAGLIFLSIKPSPARIRIWSTMQRANHMMEELAAEYERVRYLDFTDGLLNRSGEPDPSLFDQDRLHLNDLGYQVLTDALEPLLYK